MDGDCVTLQEMLEAREWRADQRNKLAAQFGQTLICLTLNVAGPVKRFPLANRTFDEAKDWIEAVLTANGIAFARCSERVDVAGHCAFFRAEADPEAVKRLMCAVELGHPLGRLMDIDVYGADGGRASRQALGFEARRCLICGGEANACARSRAHGVEALQETTLRQMRDYFSARLCRRIGQAAVKALSYELSATPKPGLVDRGSSGAHADMDFTTFLDAISAISPYFYVFAGLGMEMADERALFAALRGAGLMAERAMHKATGGVNTHRGAIFLLGLISGACGLLYSRGQALTPDAVLDAASGLGVYAMRDFERLDTAGARSHGERAYLRYGAGGARRQAADGFPAVRQIALPELSRRLSEGASPNDASVAALLALIAGVEDTNLLARGGKQSAERVRADVKRGLAQAKDIEDIVALASALDGEFIRANLSPGGCADLLSAAWMLLFICTEVEDKTDVD